ncbi:MAG: hypothetical protein JOY70_10160 [Acidisphaera sp.]|nr:hypothetical protein [Acidisphaera sp.]
MSGQTTDNNGGEAQSAGEATGGATAIAAQTDLMHQYGGPAPGQTPGAAAPPEAPQPTTAGDVRDTPPAGGFVRAR